MPEAARNAPRIHSYYSAYGEPRKVKRLAICGDEYLKKPVCRCSRISRTIVERARRSEAYSALS